MVTRADLVFEGAVIGTRSEWRVVEGNRIIFTLVDFQATEVLKGQARNPVTLQFLGGTIGEVTMEIAGMPKFKAGDRTILFVQGNGVYFCPIVGVYHGKFEVRMDGKTGKDVILMHDGRPLRDAAEIGSAEARAFGVKRASLPVLMDRGPMDVVAFKSIIRLELHKTKESK